ncbi:MAG: FkbM family methyltransferase [bacterium]
MAIKQFIDSFKDEIISAAGALDRLDKVVIFGAGNAGRYAKNYLEKNRKEVLFFCDNDPKKQGMSIDSVKVFGPQKLLTHDNYVCIASDWAREIALQLRDMGIKNYFDFGPLSNLQSDNGGSGENGDLHESERWKEHFNPDIIFNHLEEIENVYNLLEDEWSKKTLLSIIRYRLTLDPACLEIASFEPYHNPMVSPETGDIIIDGGAWIGDTALNFARGLDLKCSIFSFEPETKNYHSLLEMIKEEGLDSIIVPVRAGLWSDDCHLFLHTSKDTKQHHMSSQGDERVDLLCLDTFLSTRNSTVDLIKMDIEGAELEALTGARKAIRRYGPKLQVCVYHKASDLWDIPLFIKSMNPQYTFYLGHHTQILFETILYAAPDERPVHDR